MVSSATGPTSIRRPSGGNETPTWRRYAVVAIGAILVALAILGLVLWRLGAEGRAIRLLPAEERRALYERTLRTLRSPCGSEKRASGLDEFCRDQAVFILEFPECEAECVSLARSNLPSPSK